MTRDDLIDVLTAVAGAYNRTIGETDIEIWGPVIGDVPKAFALKAIRDHMRDHPGVWLEPGHIFQRWKAFRLDQAARESRESREARQAALDARLVETVQELAASTEIPPKYGRRTPALELSVRCPWQSCRANPGKPCVRHDGTPLRRTPFHPGRTELVRARAAEAG